MRTMGFHRRATLHLDLGTSTEDDAERLNNSPEMTPNDLPDIEQVEGEEKSRKATSTLAEKADNRQKEAAVEVAIAKLPSSE